MWPFRKKTPPKQKITVKSVLCIPGFLNDTTELFARTDGAFMIVGDILMDIHGERFYSFEATKHDLKTKALFEAAEKITPLPEMFLNVVETHTSVFYISSETGNFRDAKSLASIGAMLLENGGTGITVENAGKAFEKKSWLELTKRVDEVACLYEMFVNGAVTCQNGYVCSCGMHNLGFPDVMVLNEEYADAVKLVRIFNFYQLIDKPVLYPYQTFRATVDAAVYLIKQVTDQPYTGQELMENPFGMWGLERVN